MECFSPWTTLFFSKNNKFVVNGTYAGIDVDCTRFIGQHAQDAITKGVLSEADIDPHLENLFKVRMRLGHFDPVGHLQQISMDDVCSDYAKALSYNGVVQSAAMFKNADSTFRKQHDNFFFFFSLSFFLTFLSSQSSCDLHL